MFQGLQTVCLIDSERVLAVETRAMVSGAEKAVRLKVGGNDRRRGQTISMWQAWVTSTKLDTKTWRARQR